MNCSPGELNGTELSPFYCIFLTAVLSTQAQTATCDNHSHFIGRLSDAQYVRKELQQRQGGGGLGTMNRAASLEKVTHGSILPWGQQLGYSNDVFGDTFSKCILLFIVFVTCV